MLFQVIIEKNKAILNLNQKLESIENSKPLVLENTFKEADADSGVITSEENIDADYLMIDQNRVNRSISSVIENEKLKRESRIPRIFKSRFSEQNIKYPRSLKFKRITKSESKNLDQLRSKLSGQHEFI